MSTQRTIRPADPQLAEGVSIEGTSNETVAVIRVKDGYRAWTTMTKFPNKKQDKNGNTIYQSRVWRVFITKDDPNTRNTTYTPKR